MVTPTFFAGACIVVAATIAYGTTQTHLVFKGIGPGCAAANCTAAGPSDHPGQPDEASAAPAPRPARSTAARRPPGHRRTAATDVTAGRRPATASGPGASRPARTRPAAAPPPPGGPGPRVTVVYRTLRRWPGGFDATMTITNRTASAVRGWRLAVRFRRARINHVWGALWFAAGLREPGAGVLIPGPARQVLAPHASARFTVQVSGPAGPPAGCFFSASRRAVHRCAS